MKQPLSTPWIIISAILVILFCACLITCAVSLAALYEVSEQINPEANGGTGQNLPEVTITPFTPAPPEVQEEAADTITVLHDTVVPANDLIEIACRLEGKCNIPKTMDAPAAPRQVGEMQSFWISNEDTHKHFQISAKLAYVSEHAYFWVEEGVNYKTNKLKTLAKEFDEKIHPTTRAFFGSEWSPGVDGDPRIYMLYANNLGFSVGGYFSSADEYHPLVNEYSNAHEMFYMQAAYSDFGKGDADVIAHEFQHMIHWNGDMDETTWVDEGFSVLSEFLNGYSPSFDYAYSSNPDVQILFWEQSAGLNSARYGGSFLFMNYFLNRFGEQATQELVFEQNNSLAGVDAVLTRLGVTQTETENPYTTEALFLDWAITNYALDKNIGDGRYYYANYADAPQAEITEKISACPSDESLQVNQFAADYIKIDCRGNFTLRFEGNTVVPMTSSAPHSGQYAFWSNQADSGDATLTHSFDFTGVNGPLTLTYWMWYDIEPDFDYLYLEVSEDGQHWEILTTPSGSGDDPSGGAFGWGYTGPSNGWVQESLDLSQYAGKSIQIRFEYVTDTAITGEGFLLDDVSIPEISYTADFESGEDDWQPAGFARVQNTLPQSFRLALITRHADHTEVQIISTGEDQTSEIPLTLDANTQEAVLVVMGTARYTRQPAGYRLILR